MFCVNWAGLYQIKRWLWRMRNSFKGWRFLKLFVTTINMFIISQVEVNLCRCCMLAISDARMWLACPVSHSLALCVHTSLSRSRTRLIVKADADKGATCQRQLWTFNKSLWKEDYSKMAKTYIHYLKILWIFNLIIFPEKGDCLKRTSLLLLGCPLLLVIWEK